MFKQAEFHLNTYNTTSEVLAVLSNMTRRYYDLSTNTAMALSEIRSMFTPQHGDRQDHDNIAIILTDGNSHEP